MFRFWRPLALTTLFAAACAGEEFTAPEASSSSNFTGFAGSGGSSGSGAQSGTGTGGERTASEGGDVNDPSAGAAGALTTSGGQPGAGGNPSGDAGAADGGTATGGTATGGTATGGASGGSSAAGAGGASGDVCPLGMTGATCSEHIRACRDLPPDSASGTYRIDPDGTGPIAPFDASCQIDDSGSWTLVLNYVHKGGTNPALTVRKDSLPLLGADQLGVDESALMQSWGHAAASLLLALQPQALRFQGRISLHERVVDFVTSDKDCIAYAVGGSTNCKAVATNSTLLATHSATLPRIATAFMSGKGDLALTEFPFYLGGQAHWAIKGETQRWEVDNTPVANVVKYSYDTVHRVWMR